MESFYKKWLQNNSRINKSLNTTNGDVNQGSTELSNDDQVPVTKKNRTDEHVQPAIERPSDISFENQDYKLIIKKGYHKRQKNFRLEDHMFYFQIIPKDSKKHYPLLSDILDFLHAGFLHLLDSIKQFYNEKDKNIAYLTLYQQPMVSGLNTGS